MVHKREKGDAVFSGWDERLEHNTYGYAEVR